MWAQTPQLCSPACRFSWLVPVPGGFVWTLNLDGAETSWTLDRVRQVERLRFGRTFCSQDTYSFNQLSQANTTCLRHLCGGPSGPGALQSKTQPELSSEREGGKGGFVMDCGHGLGLPRDTRSSTSQLDVPEKIRSINFSGVAYWRYQLHINLHTFTRRWILQVAIDATRWFQNSHASVALELRTELTLSEGCIIQREPQEATSEANKTMSDFQPLGSSCPQFMLTSNGLPTLSRMTSGYSVLRAPRFRMRWERGVKVLRPLEVEGGSIMFTLLQMRVPEVSEPAQTKVIDETSLMCSR